MSAGTVRRKEAVMFIGEIEEVGVIEPVVLTEPQQETDADVHPVPTCGEPVPA